MSAALPKLPKAFAVHFEDLEEWSVRSFFSINWKWADDHVKPLANALERKRERVDKEESPLSSLQLVTIRFDGSMEPRDLDGKKRFKGNLYFAEPGDVVYSKIDVRNGAIGVVPDELGRVAVSTEFPVYRVRPEVATPRYVRLVFRTRPFRQLINSMISGASGRKRVKPVQLESIEVPLPPLPVQRAIVAQWQAARAEARRLRAEAEAVSEEVGNDVLKALGIPVKAPDDLPKTFALPWKAVDRFSVGYLQRMAVGAGKIEKVDYPVEQLGSITDIAYGITKNQTNRPGAHARPYLRVANVQAGTLDLSEIKYLDVPDDELERYRLEKGDLLVCEGNSADLVGRPAIWNNEIEDCVHQNHVLRARPSEKLLPKYALEYMQTVPAATYFRARAKRTTNLASINSTDLSEMPIPLLPLDVQRAIVEAAQEKRREAARLRAEAKRQRQAAKTTLEALILGTEALGEEARL